MDVTKLAESLQDAEIAILKALKSGAALSVESLAAKTYLSPEAINRAALWLHNKQLISVKETPRFKISLDELGKRYAESKLPERKFLTAIDVRPAFPDEVAKNAGLGKQEILFSLGYWKKKDCIKIEKGRISIAPAGKEYLTKETLEERFLKKLQLKGCISHEELDEEDRAALESLKKRRLVKEIKEKIREFSATELGRKVADAIKSEKRIGQLTPNLIKTKAWKGALFRRYDIVSQVPKKWPGKKQAYRKFLDEVKEELVALGFEEMSGPLVETAFWNNDALYMPQDHPARGIHDAYFIRDPKYGKVADKDALKAVKAVHENGGNSGSIGWRYEFDEHESARLMLRSQGTALSARMLANPDIKIPGAYFGVARCYRPDKVDATHLTEFNQCEGIVLGKDLTFRNLLGLLAEFAKKITGSDKVRWRPHYFPFTEPSLEADSWHPGLKQWIETLPAGIMRPEVTAPFGIKVPVLAWGIGIDRLFMIRESINDIRQLFSQDLQWLREVKI